MSEANESPAPKKRRTRTPEELRAKARQLLTAARDRERAQRAKEAKMERKADTARKVLAGAWILTRLQEWREGTDEDLRKAELAWMRDLSRFLKRDRDRELFGFKPNLKLSDEERGIAKKKRDPDKRDS